MHLPRVAGEQRSAQLNQSLNQVSGQQAAEAGLFTAARSAEQMDGQVEEWVARWSDPGGFWSICLDMFGPFVAFAESSR